MRSWGSCARARVFTSVHTHFLFCKSTFLYPFTPVAQVGEFLHLSSNTEGLYRAGSTRMLQLCGRVSHDGAGGKRGEQ